MALWTPAQLTSSRWFDFSLASSVSQVGGDILQVNDISGNGGHLSQGDNAKRPAYTLASQNGLNVGTFDGVDEFLQLGSDFALGTSHTIFIAWKPAATITAATPFQCLLGGGSYTFPSSTTSDYLLSLGSVTGRLVNERISSIVVAFGPTGADIYGYGETSVDISGGTIIGQRFTTSGNVFLGRRNGATSFGSATNLGGYSLANTRYPTLLRFIGSRAGTSGFFNGQIWEVIVFASYLSQGDTELTEGYLAWKWGIDSSLPSDHPYKNAAPTTGSQSRRRRSLGGFGL